MVRQIPRASVPCTYRSVNAADLEWYLYGMARNSRGRFKEIFMRKMIMMALAGYLWRKFSGRSVKPVNVRSGMRRY